MTNRAELIAAILDFCTLDDTCTQESLEACTTDTLIRTRASQKRLLAQYKAEYEEEEEAKSRQMPSWAVSESELGPDPRDGAW